MGIARSSRGDIFVTTDDGVFTFGEVQVPDPNDPDYPKCLNPNKAEHPCDIIGSSARPSARCSISTAERERPYFLEFDADDVLYIAATDGFSSKVFSYDPYPTGQLQPGVVFEIGDERPATSPCRWSVWRCPMAMWSTDIAPPARW